MRNPRQRRRLSEFGRSLFTSRKNRSKWQSDRRRRRPPQRDMRIEPLEPRQLLAVGPQLAALMPNAGLPDTYGGLLTLNQLKRAEGSRRVPPY